MPRQSLYTMCPLCGCSLYGQLYSQEHVHVYRVTCENVSGGCCFRGPIGSTSAEAMSNWKKAVNGLVSAVESNSISPDFDVKGFVESDNEYFEYGVHNGVLIVNFHGDENFKEEVLRITRTALLNFYDLAIKKGRVISAIRLLRDNHEIRLVRGKVFIESLKTHLNEFLSLIEGTDKTSDDVDTLPICSGCENAITDNSKIGITGAFFERRVVGCTLTSRPKNGINCPLGKGKHNV
jgi:hypothetical protein